MKPGSTPTHHKACAQTLQPKSGPNALKHKARSPSTPLLDRKPLHQLLTTTDRRASVKCTSVKV